MYLRTCTHLTCTYWYLFVPTRATKFDFVTCTTAIALFHSWRHYWTSKAITPMPNPIVTHSDLSGALPLVARGKVRDLYQIDDQTLLFVATDRISAYDVIMENVAYL